MAVGNCTSCEMKEREDRAVALAQIEFANEIAAARTLGAGGIQTSIPPVNGIGQPGATGIERPLQIG